MFYYFICTCIIIWHYIFSNVDGILRQKDDLQSLNIAFLFGICNQIRILNVMIFDPYEYGNGKILQHTRLLCFSSEDAANVMNFSVEDLLIQSTY